MVSVDCMYSKKTNLPLFYHNTWNRNEVVVQGQSLTNNVSGGLNSVWSKYLVKDGAHGQRWAAHFWFCVPAFLVLRSRVPGFAFLVSRSRIPGFTFPRSWFCVPGILRMWALGKANFIQECVTGKNMNA